MAHVVLEVCSVSTLCSDIRNFRRSRQLDGHWWHGEVAVFC